MNQVGVPVANSEEMMEAAPAGLVMATAWIEDGRAPKRAREAEALFTNISTLAKTTNQ